MSEIPDDIMKAAEAVYAGLHANNYDADCDDRERAEDVAEIAAAIFAERQRNQWQPMDTAPKDGTEFVAIERREGALGLYARVYKYEGHPNYWHSKREGVCIRPDYQDRYVWAALPQPMGGA